MELVYNWGPLSRANPLEAIRLYHGDFREAKLDSGSYHMALVDPPYSDPELINAAIRVSRMAAKGPTLCFMYPEDLAYLDTPPEQVLHWIKPVSTKNTSRRYSKFVEVIACYDLDYGRPLNQGLHWSNRTGVFTDALMEKPLHPYKKPESLIKRLILNHTEEGDIILDVCTGSGTVLQVARELGRWATGYEITDNYAKLAANELAKSLRRY